MTMDKNSIMFGVDIGVYQNIIFQVISNLFTFFGSRMRNTI